PPRGRSVLRPGELRVRHLRVLHPVDPPGGDDIRDSGGSSGSRSNSASGLADPIAPHGPYATFVCRAVDFHLPGSPESTTQGPDCALWTFLVPDGGPDGLAVQGR